jgi:signal transduction histidine kinase
MQSGLRNLLKGTAVVLLTLSVGVGAFAQERGTKAEAKAMADAAYEHIKKVGPEKAYKDFTTDKANWVKKDMYVMVYDNKSVGLAHGANEKIVGKDMSNVKDANDVPIVPSLIALSAKGGGWLDYDWPDPVTKKIAAKTTYARKLPNGEGFIGVGVYQ